MTEYDSDEPPTTLEEAMQRIKQSIVWEFLESGMYQEMPCSTYINWNNAAQKRYKKAAEAVIKQLNFKIEPKIADLSNKPKNGSINKVVKTLREYLRG
tara:strand:+ start:4645 stop:4938 length:294 start_codon:yes stop_codon:yes gene_type:complete